MQSNNPRCRAIRLGRDRKNQCINQDLQKKFILFETKSDKSHCSNCSGFVCLRYSTKETDGFIAFKRFTIFLLISIDTFRSKKARPTSSGFKYYK